MKKLLLSAICLLLTLPVFAETFQYTYEGQTLNYECISPGECAVSENPGISGAVSIPKTITYKGKEYTINKIGDDAFKECKRLESISIPNSVTSIGDHAFYYCNRLESITIPNSVTSIEFEAFAGSGLSSITIPDSVTSIGSAAFSECSNLESVNILSSSLESLGSHMFANCTHLRSVSLPTSSITSIGNGVFFLCTSLESITIPNSVTSIGALVFDYCLRLESITIPDSVTTIGPFAFEGCTALSSITLGRKLERIEHSAFDGCINLKNVTCLALIPPTVVTDQRRFSPNNCTLYVSFPTWPLYMVSQWWKDFRYILPIKNMQNAARDEQLNVSGSNGSIAVENAPIGATVVVKDTNNTIIASEEVKEANQSIPVNRKGVFIVTVDNVTYKVAL